MSELLPATDDSQVAEALVAAQGDLKLVAERLYGDHTPSNVARVLQGLLRATPSTLEQHLRILMLLASLELLTAAKDRLMETLPEASGHEALKVLQMIYESLAAAPTATTNVNVLQQFGSDNVRGRLMSKLEVYRTAAQAPVRPADAVRMTPGAEFIEG